MYVFFLSSNKKEYSYSYEGVVEKEQEEEDEEKLFFFINTTVLLLLSPKTVVVVGDLPSSSSLFMECETFLGIRVLLDSRLEYLVYYD